MTAMTKAERSDLCALIRRREKLEKTAASQRSAELLADFERQLASIYKFDNDEPWRTARAAAERAVEQAQVSIADRCKELGIPKEFAPGLSMGWYGRGENASRDRRAELRKVAETRLAAMEKAARTKIEMRSIELQEEIIRGGLLSADGQSFLSQLPRVETLMLPLDARVLDDSIRQVTGEKRRLDS